MTILPYSQKPQISVSAFRTSENHPALIFTQRGQEGTTQTVVDLTYVSYPDLMSCLSQPNIPFSVIPRITQLLSNLSLASPRMLSAPPVQREFGLAFQKAAANGHIETIEELIRLKPFNEIPPLQLEFALQNAAAEGHTETVKALIQSNRFNEISLQELCYATYEAIENGHIGTAKILIESNRFNQMPLYYLVQALYSSAKKGGTELVKTLLKLNQLSEISPEELAHAIDEAVDNRQPETSQALVNSNLFKKIQAGSKGRPQQPKPAPASGPDLEMLY